MSSPQLRFFNVGTDWTKASIGYGKYVNNSNKDIFLQRQVVGVPSANESGIRIRSGQTFDVAPDIDGATYLRTQSGTAQVGIYDKDSDGGGSSVIVDPVSGNHLSISSDGAFAVSSSMQFYDELKDEYKDVSLQNPLPVDGDSIYIKDIDNINSVTTDWTDVDDAGIAIEEIPFANLRTRISNATADNPKILRIMFRRTQSIDQVGLGCCGGGNFSNVKMCLIGSGDEIRECFDDSANNTKYTSRNYQFPPDLGNGVQLEFYTVDTVCISNITIHKAQKTVTRLQALKPNKQATDIKASNNGNLQVSLNEYGDTPAIDSFARLRTSNPYTLFDSKQLHDKAPLLFSEVLAGGATSVHSEANARTRLSVTANIADYAIRQTKMRPNYQPGKAQLSFITFFCEQTAGLTKRVGMFDGVPATPIVPRNGIFFETNQDVYWKIAKNGTVTEAVTQANWNVDTLDGSGDEANPSGIKLHTNSTQIAVIDYEWLGVGRVRVGFCIDGLIYYVHYFNHANDPAFDSVYMSTPNLPIRYDIQSDGTAAGYIDHICSTVMSEGGREDNGVIRYISTQGIPLTAAATGTIYAVAAIRLKESFYDASIKLLDLIMQIQTANHQVEWILKLNPIVADTLTFVDQPDSAVQIARGATVNTVTGGYDMSGGFVESGGQQSGRAGSASKGIDNAVLLGSAIDGTRDMFVLCARPISGSTNVAVEAALTWRELL